MISIGIDIGGTFTDVSCVASTPEGDRLYWSKVPSTPKEPSHGVLASVAKILEMAGESPERVARFMHGTTVATNAVLEEKGARIGILMTKGFEDTLEIGRQLRTQMYEMALRPETPGFLAPGRRRFGITERISGRGEILIPLNEAEVRAATRELVERFQVEAIAICYLFSFRNPIHELRTREIILSEFPRLRVSLSHEIDPVFREYERLCVTAFDAYLRPVVQAYVETLAHKLQQSGIQGEFLMMQSRGGLASARTAANKPVTTLLSGPAAGVIGAKFVAERSGYPNVITLDMGGTSADIALITEGKPIRTTEGEIRGYPLRTPMVDVKTIGAGGGSIAWLDAAGGLRVGPQSAGADPGPACYSLGGQEPTVTDASVVLGYLDPSFFAGGNVKLDPDAAWRAVEKIAKPLGFTVPEAAFGIHRIVNAKMADAIRLVSVRKGYDPRQFTLLLFGGAGPVNGGALCRELSIPTALVPEAPGVLSAFGLLVSDIEYDSALTFSTAAEGMDYARAAEIFAELDRLGMNRMRHDRVPLDQVQRYRFADMRYSGQSYELEVPVENGLHNETIGAICQHFHEIHEQVYGHGNRKAPVEFVNLRMVHVYSLPKPQVNGAHRAGSFEKALLGHRRSYFGEYSGFMETPIYTRTELPYGEAKPGPAIIQQSDTTTVVYPGEHFFIDPHGNLILQWSK